MSDLERRLHHAARELRSIDIEPPPLATIAPSRASARRPSGLGARVPALVMPVLFVLGGLAVIGGALGHTAEPPEALPAEPAAVAPPAQSGSTADPGVSRPLSARQELALIASLKPTVSAPEPAPVSPGGSGSEQLRTVSRLYR